jgi:hypothetical protein
MSRFFTRAQAERLLPELEAAIREAIYLKRENKESEAVLQEAAQRIMLLGGVRIDREKMVHQRARRETSAAALKQAIERVHGFGCMVKDLDIGLVDFPTLLRGEEVYLCWKLGESAIDYWHGIDEGFRGRKRIDQEFLDNHRGDSEN